MYNRWYWLATTADEMSCVLNKSITAVFCLQLYQKRNVKSFIDELNLDAIKFYKYCRMSVACFNVSLNLLRDKLTTLLILSITAEEMIFLS